MGYADFCVFLFLFHPFLLKLADSKCPQSFTCKHLGDYPLEFPLTDHKQPECGLFKVDCDSPLPKIMLSDDGYWYDIIERMSTNRYRIEDALRKPHLMAQSCMSFRNMSPRDSPSISFTISPNLTLFTCDNFRPDHNSTQKSFENYKNYTDCRSFTVYYARPEYGDLMEESNNIPDGCSVIQMPMNSSYEDLNDVFKLISTEFSIEWSVSPNCLHCHSEGGQCVANSENEFECKKVSGKSKRPVILATAIPGGAFIVCLLVCLIIWQRRKRIKGAYLLSRNMSSNPSSKSDIEGGSFYFGIPVFSYTELVEATNNFDSSKELGDGGFGTVYYGKLKDGREVAIKRLYEHNYKRVEQFMNEIKILTCLRHPNLVSLYGCTSRRSRELLLVYEYVCNGTVADHLHGERAKEAPLTWDVRMSIAIETASALSYLHKSDIIHRDVKTNNILLDENYCVKVADFGLSRLFPNDVSHISTAPQGTPGYVDPEYHQCYQLTDKSDVYSFGVVLIELISSMPAVDISRHRHEINLANLALNKIQRCAFNELIDSSLGYDTDIEVTRMTTSVAELAFRCLQLEKEMRPSMDEVFDFLKDIQSGDELTFEKVKEGNGKIPPSPETDDIVLLKNKNLQSPIAVTDKWVSSSSTTASSIE